MNRRDFIRKSLLGGNLPLAKQVARVFSPPASANETKTSLESRISFVTSDSQYQTIYSRALDVLERNITTVAGYSEPVLIEGSNYGGIWLECAPHEGLVYSATRPDIARNNHLAFFALQREDRQLPCWLRTSGPGFAQIQMVVPVAATAWELWSRPATASFLRRLTAPARVGTTGSAATATREVLGCAKVFALGIRDTITVPAGPEFPTAVPMGTRASVRPWFRFLGYVPIFPPPCTVDGWHWPLWLEH